MTPLPSSRSSPRCRNRLTSLRFLLTLFLLHFPIEAVDPVVLVTQPVEVGVHLLLIQEVVTRRFAFGTNPLQVGPPTLRPRLGLGNGLHHNTDLSGWQFRFLVQHQ